MDVILLSAVDKLGAAGAVIRVKPGYARNYLIPKRLAALATPEQLKAVEELHRQRAQKAKRLQAQAEAVKQKIESRGFSTTLTLGDDGKAFGAVTAHDVYELLTQSKFTLDKHAVQLSEPIKALGTYYIPVKLLADVTATLKLKVVKE